jgi:ribokinase
MESMQKSIIVIGSSNTDMVVKSKRLPAPGETILGGTFGMFAGGKGANQAVAAVRLGGDVSFVGKRGQDIFGRNALEGLQKEGINTEHFSIHSGLPSGVALINIDDSGENCIVVASGANTALNAEDVLLADHLITNSSVLLLQLETSLETVQFAAMQGIAKGATIILNPAPAQPLPESLLQVISVITPNETEAGMLTGISINNISSAKDAAVALKKKGVQTIVITLGAEGVLIYHEDQFIKIDAEPVTAIDTTAAGDVFNGALAVGLAEGKSIEVAARYACLAASISVTRMGAQSSAPFKRELAHYVHH